MRVQDAFCRWSAAMNPGMDKKSRGLDGMTAFDVCVELKTVARIERVVALHALPAKAGLADYLSLVSTRPIFCL